MGVEHYAVCHDCKLFAGLDKYWAWCPTIDKTQPARLQISLLTADILAGCISSPEGWIFKALILHGFIAAHSGHRIEIVDEYAKECDYVGMCDCESYSRQVHDPVKLCSYEPDPIFGNCWRD